MLCAGPGQSCVLSGLDGLAIGSWSLASLVALRLGACESQVNGALGTWSVLFAVWHSEEGLSLA